MTMSDRRPAPMQASALARFRDDRRGVVAPIVAITIMPLIFLSGAAID
ncbi:hypothetical protein [Methylobacterium sp. Gmos1]